MVDAWVESEFETLDFGDMRLNRRAKSFVSEAACIGDSNPDRCRKPGSLKATYRMVDNPKVGASKLFEAHNAATRERCRDQSLVYLAQDTSEFDLTKAKTVVEGAGVLGGRKNRRGFYFHPSWAISADGVALGQVDQIIWTRDPQSLEASSKQRQAQRRKMCFEEKESARWVEILQSNEQLARSVPETSFVSVADSEADICDLFAHANDFPTNFDLIIRAGRHHDVASVIDVGTGNPMSGVSTVDEALQAATPRFCKKVSVGYRPASKLPSHKDCVRQQERSARDAVLTIRTITVTLKGPRTAGGGHVADSTVNIVELLEYSPPEGEPPIRWVLYTTLPVETEEEVLAVIGGYCKRWNIELYFKTLKSGLKVESMRYKTLSRYLNAFAMLAVVAWRVEYLKTAVRADPDAPCSKYFSTDQWVAIVTFSKQEPADRNQPPTMQEFLIIVSQLGGYINKKSQGPPGSRTIWRGMSRFETIVQAFQIYSEMTCGV